MTHVFMHERKLRALMRVGWKTKIVFLFFLIVGDVDFLVFF